MPKTISIHEQEFEVSTPYAEGHTLSAIEAKVLNQVRAENIANNFRDKVKKAIAGGEGVPSLDQVRTDFTKYDSEYVFTEAAAGGSTRSLSPLEKECRRLARNIIDIKLAQSNRKKKDIDKEALEAEVVRIAATDTVVRQATRNLKDAEKLAASVADEAPSGEAAA